VDYPKANSKGKKAMNPKGKVALLVWSLNDPSGMKDGLIHLYSIKSNAIGSLNIDKPDATFTGKANIIELKFGEDPISIEGNCTLVLDLHQGVPWWNPPIWDPHKVGITLYKNKSKGGIWYSNNWIYAKTEKDKICVGWIKVVDGIPVVESDLKSNEKAVESVSVGEVEGLKVYPNPFDDEVRFEFISPLAGKTRIDIYDISGRLVQTIFDDFVEAGTNYNASFRPEAEVSGMYFYRMKLGDMVYNGKLVYKKE
jgi:hypothetical protein